MRVTVKMLPCFALFAVIGTAQTNSTPAKPANTVRSGQLGGVATAGFAVGIPVIGNIIPAHPPASPTGHPYSAKQITEHVQTLADGTHISQAVSKVHYYRDSQGRTRIEREFTLPPGTQGTAVGVIIIADPVAGYQYIFDTHSHTAQRTVLSRHLQQNSQWFQKTAPPMDASLPRAGNIIPGNSVPRVTTGAETQRESLGTHTVEGVSAEGMRMTTTYPAGTVGNDREFTSTSETWMSKDLGVTVLSKNSDPRYGETTTRLTDISQTEPDPNLFLVPPDYTVVDPQ